MGLTALRLSVIGAVILCGIGVVYAISASTLSISSKKGMRQMLAYVFIGTGVCIGSLAFIVFQARLSVLQAAGVIETAHVHAEGRGHRTDFTVRVPSGGVLALNADDISPYFRAGEQVSVRYQGYTGSIIKARFLSSTGVEEGVFNGTDSWSPYGSFLMGLFIIWSGIKIHKRDPEGAEDDSGRDPKPYGAVDKFSLIPLSERSRKTRRS